MVYVSNIDERGQAIWSCRTCHLVLPAEPPCWHECPTAQRMLRLRVCVPARLN